MAKVRPKKRRTELQTVKEFDTDKMAMDLAELFQLPPNLIWYTVKFAVNRAPVIECECELWDDGDPVIEGKGSDAKIKKMKKKYEISIKGT